jgi:hypothetical protein
MNDILQGMIEVKMPTKEELAWVAGFMEGEGHIGICQDVKRGHCFLQITASSISKDLLENMQRLFGGNIIQANHAGYKPRYNHLFRWYTQCDKAVDVLKAIEPFIVGTKNEQIVFCYYFKENKDRRKNRCPDDIKRIECLRIKINSYNSNQGHYSKTEVSKGDDNERR